MLLLKILDGAQLAELRAGPWVGAPVDRVDGFVHFSTPAQAEATAGKHFAGRADLLVAAVESEALGDALRWEPARGGDLFPHLYRDLRPEELLWVRPLPLGADGRHVFPSEARP